MSVSVENLMLGRRRSLSIYTLPLNYVNTVIKVKLGWSYEGDKQFLTHVFFEDIYGNTSIIETIKRVDIFDFTSSDNIVMDSEVRFRIVDITKPFRWYLSKRGPYSKEKGVLERMKIGEKPHGIFSRLYSFHDEGEDSEIINGMLDGVDNLPEDQL